MSEDKHRKYSHTICSLRKDERSHGLQYYKRYAFLLLLIFPSVILVPTDS